MENAYSMNVENFDKELEMGSENVDREETGVEDQIDESSHEEQVRLEVVDRGGEDASNQATEITTEKVVDSINEVYVDNLENGKIQIGQLVLQHCFDGDPDRAKSKNPKKDTTYGDVCEHEALRINVKELGRCVRAAAQQSEFKKADVEYSALSFHALIELSKLPDKTGRVELGRKANTDGMTVRDIQKAVNDWKTAQASKPIESKVALRALKQLKGILGNGKLREFLADETLLREELGSDERITLSKMASETAKQLQEWSPLLDGARKTISKIELDDQETTA